MFVSESNLFSKSGALINVNSPLDASKLNLDESDPPFLDQTTVSFAEKVRTALVFSSIEVVEVRSPAKLPSGPVINGVVSSIVTVTDWVDEFSTKSVAFIFRRYSLLLSESVGLAASGAIKKVKTPEFSSILNNAASAPPSILQVTVSSDENVPIESDPPCR